MGQEREKLLRQLEMAMKEVNQRDGDIALLQRRLEAFEDEAKRARKALEKAKQDNSMLRQVKFPPI
ncbi:unnamed protein product [Protopolystoma xenopodis]|uniref:Uncharacterized protein n=1 Tax=Protopolystoma xenopodis TaxID=117903 RepID=A0A3S5CKK5_9PLAT|nr:unnamed protein product [Protopolystoma xenopodis]